MQCLGPARTRRRRAGIGSGLGLGLALVGCTAVGRLPESPGGPAWPPPPESPRLVWVGELRGPESLGLDGGFAARAVRFLAGEPVPTFRHPSAVAVAGRAAGTGGAGTEGPARLAVADSETRTVHLFDLARGAHTALTSASDAPLRSPVGLAFDADGRLYVCDSARGEVLRYRSDGAFDRVVGGPFARPAGVAVDPVRGRLYVADAAEHVVRRLDLEGAPLGAIAQPFAFPTHLAVDREGNVLVSDSMGFQVVIVSPEGERLAAVGKVGDGSGDLQRPKGVAADSAGHVYVADAIFDNVQVFGRDGRLLLSVGSAGNGPGELALPAGVASDEADRLYIADTWNGRVVVLRYLHGKAGE